ncbi:MAG: aminotransferase class I/II-fold pyridoxal phosphate-dependent enzyme [Bacteroidales bacterium]|nr:aminotransferase class I/II-fold pyridoxal phosphate-dependent enzyme [Bacteroidales bacterium]
MKIIDLRSDTVTRPTEGMLESMMTAKLGDDVFGDDPTVIALERKVAGLFGMEEALLCPSGTMTNQIAINVHTKPGDEVITDKLSHIYHYEGGGIAFNSGASVRLVDGDRGRFTLKEVQDNINPDDIHHPVTRLVSVENTCNKGGGSYYDFGEIGKIAGVCKEKELKLHLDGARLFNALVETTDSPAQYGDVFDSISICLSKGLGAPIGSLLIGDRVFIKQARRIRKVFGGGMRQAGIIAAAGIYALDYNVKRLKDDHHRAKQLCTLLESVSYVDHVLPVDTNIVVFRVNESINASDFINRLKEKSILVIPFGPQTIRMVTHLDFDDKMLEYVISSLLGFSV